MKESLSARPIQWFPGHMTKTLRLMEKDIRNVDAVLQLSLIHISEPTRP